MSCLNKKIKSYILREMSPQEREAFEKKVQNDVTLAHELELQKKEFEFMKLLREEDVHNKAKDLRNNS